MLLILIVLKRVIHTDIGMEVSKDGLSTGYSSVQISKIFSKHSAVSTIKKSTDFCETFEESHISVPDIFENQTFLLPHGPWSLYKVLNFARPKDDWFESSLETLERNERDILKKMIQKFQAGYSLFNQPTKSPYLESDILDRLKAFIVKHGLIKTYENESFLQKEIQTFRMCLLSSNRVISQFQLDLNANKITLKSLEDFRTFLFCPAWEFERSLILYGLRLHLEEVSPLASYIIQKSTVGNDLTLNKRFNSGVFFCYIILYYYVYSKSLERVTAAVIKWKEEFYDNELRSLFSFYTFMFDMFDSFPAL